MAAGFGLLRLAPVQFWAMTPRELSAALDGALGRARPLQPPTRRELIALMQRYPDHGGSSHE